MSAELTQADEDALLAAEAFSLGLHNPAIWDRYVEARTTDVYRRINERFPNTAPTNGGTGSGAIAGLGNPEAGDDAGIAVPSG